MGILGEPQAFFGQFLCKVQPHEVTCTVPEELSAELLAKPFTHLEIFITVKVAEGAQSGEENSASISGGAPTASVTTPIVVDSAATPFGVEQYELRPENAGGSPDTQAGSHPFQLTSVIALNQAAEATVPPAAVKDLRFNLPPGLIGNPTPFAQCPLTKFLANASEGQNFCPDDTVVGIASVSISFPVGGSPSTFAVPLFALVPSVGEPARFGFDVVGDPVYLDTSVRTGSDYGVTVTVPNITEISGFISSRVTFWGVPGDPRHDSVRGWNCLSPQEHAPACAATEAESPPPLLTLPTACTGPVQTNVETDSWENAGIYTAPFGYTFKDNLGRPVGMDGCNQLPFYAEHSRDPRRAGRKHADGPDGRRARAPGIRPEPHGPGRVCREGPLGDAAGRRRPESGGGRRPAGLHAGTDRPAEPRRPELSRSGEGRDGEDQDAAAAESSGRRRVPRDAGREPVRLARRAVRVRGRPDLRCPREGRR